MYVRVADLFTYTKRCENSALYLHMFLLVFSTLVSRNVDRCGQTRIYLVRNSWPRNFCIFTFLSDLFLFTFLYFIFLSFCYVFLFSFCVLYFYSSILCFFSLLCFVLLSFNLMCFGSLSVFCTFIILFDVFLSIWLFISPICFGYFHWYVLINSLIFDRPVRVILRFNSLVYPFCYILLNSVASERKRWACVRAWVTSRPHVARPIQSPAELCGQSKQL